MDLRLLSIIGFLSLALVVTGATLTSEEYWQSMLPNTQMPKSIRDILPSDVTEEKSTAVGVGKGGVSVDTGKGKPGGTSVGVGKGGVSVDTGKGKPGGTSVGVSSGKGVGVSTGKPDGGSGTNVGVGKGGVSVNTGPKKKPVVVNVKPGPSPFTYNYAASEAQLRDDPNVAYFFQEKDLHPGTTMDLRFTKTTSGATFLTRKEAQAIPFSSTKFSQVLQRYSIAPGSEEAQVMKNTIQECEEPAVQGEAKYCATSLESMVEFTTSKLGSNVQALSTEVDKEESKKQQYTMTNGVQMLASDKAVVCHAQPYAYAVYYCHATKSTKAYKVPLVGADGTKANAVAICHTDTSRWNPKHLAFQVLKIKPGTTPVCHFLPEDHVVWVQN